MEEMPIRILHMISSIGVGGSQAFVMNVYKNIDRNKIQFDFIIDHPNDMYYQKEIEELGGRIYIFPTYHGNNYVEIRKVWESFFSSHPEYKILHSHKRSYASLYLPIAKKKGLKTIIHSHSVSNGKGAKEIIKYLFQIPLRYQADYYMACSQKAGQWLFGKRICKSNVFKVVKNAIEVKKFIYDEKIRETVRNELGIGEEFVLGFLARVTEPKNPLFVIRVWEEMIRLGINGKLLFVGDGEMLPVVKKEAGLRGLQDKIIFTGARKDAERMFMAMDCYIFPSKWEGLGISLIEAQASGLKCICSENIQEEAIITDLVDCISLSEGTGKWAEHIIKDLKPRFRPDYGRKVINAGYDILANADEMSKFYLGLLD